MGVEGLVSRVVFPAKPDMDPMTIVLQFWTQYYLDKNEEGEIESKERKIKPGKVKMQGERGKDKRIDIVDACANNFLNTDVFAQWL